MRRLSGGGRQASKHVTISHAFMQALQQFTVMGKMVWQVVHKGTIARKD
jgi:hypothetical protein